MQQQQPARISLENHSIPLHPLNFLTCLCLQQNYVLYDYEFATSTKKKENLNFHIDLYYYYDYIVCVCACVCHL